VIKSKTDGNLHSEYSFLHAISLRGGFSIVVGFLLLATQSILAAETEDKTSSHIVFAPATDQYPQFLADPRTPHTGLVVLGVTDSEIAGAGDVRINTKFRARFGILRFGDTNDPQAWQLDFEGGFFAHFDYSNNLDGIGWDGIYELFLTKQISSKWFFRFGDSHDSAHVGDEFMEKKGRERIGYTREELIFGSAWVPNKIWRAYSEAGWSWDLKGDEDHLRLQFGIEYYGKTKFRLTGQEWYVAFDTNLFEERNWSPATSLQLGLIQPAVKPGERFRFVVEFYNGRSVLGEFSFEDETYLGFGFYYDY
jgi:hypothetical protein